MFNESNTVEAYLYDLLSGPIKPVAANAVQEPESHYGRAHKGLGWRCIASADIPRQTQEVLVETWVREALIRLNPEIAAQPEPRRRGALQAARHHSLGALRRPDSRQRGNDGLAARRAFHALRPEQRACAGSADRLRQPRPEPVRRHPAIHLSAPAAPNAGPTWCCWSMVCRWC